MHPKNILLFNTDNKKVRIAVTFKDGTFWLTQKTMAELFQVKIPAISKHFKNIFESEKLDENSVISKMETTASDGKVYETSFYRLEVVLAVGYRVNSTQATQFRKWATEQEHDKFKVIQDVNYESDFDKEVKKIKPSQRHV